MRSERRFERGRLAALWHYVLRCMLPEYAVPLPVKQAYLAAAVSSIRSALVEAESGLGLPLTLLESVEPNLRSVCSVLRYPVCDELLDRAVELARSLATAARPAGSGDPLVDAMRRAVESPPPPPEAFRRLFDRLVALAHGMPPSRSVQWLTVVATVFLSMITPPTELHELPPTALYPEAEGELE